MPSLNKVISLVVCVMVAALLIQHRYQHLPEDPATVKVTDWDALGYYIYLPSIIIYKDYKELKWFPEIEEQYHVAGGNLYQAQKLKNSDNYFFKYLGGVAVLQLPFFLVAHYLAPSLGYPQDGFSMPYQYAVVWAALFYAILGIFILRRVLKSYFTDVVVAITILLLIAATNFIEYAAIASGMSHAYIFPLYALVLLTTMKWHNKPSGIWALLIGFIIGLAMISRPTEGIMLFIPLFWNTYNKEAAQAKWQKVKAHRVHIMIAIAGGLIGILPQLLYWKSATSSWIFDVGSAWDFLTPHLRVLTGWEKGWFIYTPITILFIVGMFFMKGQPFKKSVLWFCLLNIYIIIAWREWTYGASYSTRALVQSYPVFALPFASFVSFAIQQKWKWVFYAVGVYCIIVNLFQLEQYNDTVLHYEDMNRKYYGAIYLDKDPTPLDMSLLDHDEVLNNTSSFKKHSIWNTSKKEVAVPAGDTTVVFELPISTSASEAWIHFTGKVNMNNGYWNGRIVVELQSDDMVKQAAIRTFNPITKDGIANPYEVYLKVDEPFRNSKLRLKLKSSEQTNVTIDSAGLILLERS